MKLLKQLKISSLVDNIHLYAILILLSLLVFIHYVYFIVLVIYIIFLYKRHLLNPKIIIYFLVVVVFFLISYFYIPKLKNSNNLKGMISSIEIKEDYKRYVLKSGINKYYIYFSDDLPYKPGDIVSVSGEIKEINNNSDFNYKIYLKCKRIYYSMYLKDIKYERTIHSFDYFRYKIFEYYQSNLNDEAFMYVKSLVLGYKLDDDINYYINTLGIGYLFCISGFHISILCLGIEKILSKFIKKESLINKLIISFLSFYIILTNFSVGVLRASLSYILKIINKKYTLCLSNLEILSIVFLMLITFNPLYIYNMAFRFSFFISLFIILSSYLLNIKNKILKSYLMGLLCYLASFPLSVNMNYEFNILTVILGPIFIYIFSIILIPLVYLLSIFPFLSNIINPLFIIFTNMISSLSSYKNLIVYMKSINSIYIVIYYFLYFSTLVEFERRKSHKKLVSFSIFFLFLILNKNISLPSIHMINVGQGDSFYLENDGENLIVDSYNTNIDYIKSCGVKKVDSILITHSDNDHVNTLLDSIDEFDIDNLIISIYEDESGIIGEAIKKVKRVTRVKKGDNISILKTRAQILSPSLDLKDKNNNSIIFSIEIKGISFLFTGDAEAPEEKEIENYYNYDFVKIAHHGSDTSTSSYFLSHVSFNNALISVGENNKYNHPSKSVIDSLKDKNIYQTNIHKSVVIYILSSKYFIYAKSYDEFFLNMISKLLNL